MDSQDISTPYMGEHTTDNAGADDNHHHDATLPMTVGLSMAFPQGSEGSMSLMQMSPMGSTGELYPTTTTTTTTDGDGQYPRTNDADGEPGIETVPPIDEPSVMVRGDNGLARWVTTMRGKRSGTTVHSAADYSFSSGMRTCCYDSDDEEANPFDLAPSPASTDSRKGKWIVENLATLRAEAEQLLHQQDVCRREREAKESAIKHALFEKELDDLGGVASGLMAPATTTTTTTTAAVTAVPKPTSTAAVAEGDDESFSGSSLLWTSRYAPRGYVDLLSEESANLSLLQWIKAWDAHVFRGRSNASAAAESITPAAAAATPAAMKTMAEIEDEKMKKLRQGGGGGGSSITKQKKEKGSSVADTRPFHKIILITGPPGAGKTTMAHIIAHQCCGYDPVEINASVDRSIGGAQGSASNNKNQLERNLQSAIADMQFKPRSKVAGGKEGAAFGSQLDRMSAKPRCLILDEIDGVASSGTGGGVIGYLLKHMSDIHRPVICLANDLHAPALRELRQHGTYYLPSYYSPTASSVQQRSFFEEAFGGESKFRKEVLILTLPVINPQRLTSRLEVILRKEREYRARYNAEMRRRERVGGKGAQERRMLPLKSVDQPVLAQLVSLSNGDVRTCLTTLQFLLLDGAADGGTSTKNQLHASATGLQAAFEQVCSKDAALSLKSVWQQLFVKQDKEKYAQLLIKADAASQRTGGDAVGVTPAEVQAAVPHHDQAPPEPVSEYERELENEARRKAAAKLKRYRQMMKERGELVDDDDEQRAATDQATTTTTTTSADNGDDSALGRPKVTTREYLEKEMQMGTWWTGKRRLPNTPGEGSATMSAPDPGFRYVLHSLFGGSRNFNAGDDSSGGDTGGGNALVEGIHEYYLQPQPLYSDHTMKKTSHMSNTLSSLDTLWGTLRNGSSASAVVSLHGLYDRLSIVAGATAFVNCSALTNSANSAYTSNPQGGMTNSLPWVGRSTVVPQLENTLKKRLLEAVTTSRQFTVHGAMMACRGNVRDDTKCYWASQSPIIMSLDVSPLLCRCLLPPNTIKFPPNFLGPTMLAGTKRPITSGISGEGDVGASSSSNNNNNRSTWVRQQNSSSPSTTSLGDSSSAFIAGTGLPGMSDQEMFTFLAQRHARYGFTYVPTLAPIQHQWKARGDNNNKEGGWKDWKSGGGGSGGGSSGAGADAATSDAPASRERWSLSPALDDSCFGGRFSNANLAAAASAPVKFAGSAVSAASYTMARKKGAGAVGGGGASSTPKPGGPTAAAAFGIMVARSDVRQTFAGEINQQRVLLAKPLITENKKNTTEPQNTPTSEDVTDTPMKRKLRGEPLKTPRKGDEPPAAAAVPSAPATTATPVKVKRDFFGRPVVVAPPPPKTPSSTSTNNAGVTSAGGTPSKKGAPAPKASDRYISVIRYLHYDGVTNGVKRAANMRDLLGE